MKVMLTMNGEMIRSRAATEKHGAQEMATHRTSAMENSTGMVLRYPFEIEVGYDELAVHI